MTQPASIHSTQRPADHSQACPTGNVAETGAIIVRIFDLLDGTALEPLAAEVAWRLINGARRQLQL